MNNSLIQIAELSQYLVHGSLLNLIETTSQCQTFSVNEH